MDRRISDRYSVGGTVDLQKVEEGEPLSRHNTESSSSSFADGRPTDPVKMADPFATAAAANRFLRPLQPQRSASRTQRLAVQRTVSMVTSLPTLPTQLTIGAPAGVDVKGDDVPEHLRELDEPCNITITDYCKTSTRDQCAGNKDLQDLLAQPRPPWSKVRWISVTGISYPAVIRPLAKMYDIHPLAVEDIVHIPQRVKADQYEKHLYVSMILLALDDTLHDLSGGPPPSQEGSKHSLRTAVPTLRSLVSTKLDEVHLGDVLGKHQQHLCMEQASLFLFRDGTLITIFQEGGHHIISSIMNQIRKEGTLLRKTEDASLLLHAVVDGIVDHALPIMEHYAAEVSDLEWKIISMRRPHALYTRYLHILSNELKMLRKVFMPTQVLVTDLMRHQREGGAAGDSFLSNDCRIYLEDVLDHAKTVTENIDSLGQLCKELIDLIFNTVAYQSNQSMQILSAISTVFLPVTFIAGVYGMNWHHFPELQWRYGYLYFWALCLTIAATVLLSLRRLGMLSRRSSL